MKKDLIRNISILIMLSFLTSTAAYCQTHTYVYDVDDKVKGYSVEMCTDYQSNNGETVQVGTIYDYPNTGEASVHFMNIADDGTVNYSKYIDAPSGYEELRAVDIVGDEGGGWGAPSGSAIYYITCLARTTLSNDRIVIIPVNYKGDMVGAAREIYATDMFGSLDGDRNFYPLHSIYLQSTGYIYVCGYYTTEYNGPGGTSLSGGGEPGYTSDKYAFVCYEEFNGAMWTGNRVLWGMTTAFDDISTIPSTRKADPDGNDYDIAMRMVETSSGHVFVTGSVNDVKPDGGGGEYWHSAVMNYHLDNQLVFWSPHIFDAGHFTNGTEQISVGHEYGIGLVEAGPSDKYVVGNYFFRWGIDDKFTDMEPSFFFVNWINNNFDHTTTGDSRATFYGFDYAIALQTLEGPPVKTFTAGDPSEVRFLIPGIAANEWCSNPLQWDDIRTFVHDIEVDYNSSSSGNINAVFNKWTTYGTWNNTTLPYTNWDSYFSLGGGISNVGWNPTLAGRENTSEDIYIAAPTTLGSPDRLQLKNIRVEHDETLPDYLHDNNCSSSSSSIDDAWGDCLMTDYAFESAYNLGHSTAVLISAGAQFSSAVIYSDVTTIPASGSGSLTTNTYAYTELDCPTYSKYKPALVGVNELGLTTKVFPNPVSTQLNIQNADGAVYKIVDITGREVSSGTLKGNEAVINTANIAVGVYIINITRDGETEKIKFVKK